MSVALLVANLLRVANEVLEGAQALATIGNRNAVYLCEQAAEKVIRARVVSAPTPDALRQYMLDVSRAISEVSVRMGVDFDARNAPASRATPIR